MQLSLAPLFTDVHPGPAGGAAHWVQTTDGKRIRVGHWQPEVARGTVLLFPGRTEYIEKYGEVAGELAARGLATIAVDWRGQGLSDRLTENRLVGHVDLFQDYQKDVGAMVRAAKELGLPRPFFLLAHSMGGAIGLRAVIEGLSVRAAAFSGPMWGIQMAPHLRRLAWALTRVMPRLGRGVSLPPGTKLDPYPVTEPFENNMLTTDPDMYAMMRDQVTAHPELGLGGPSYLWLGEALAETTHLAGRAAPNLPCVTFVGSNERIVDMIRIEDRMRSWSGGRLEVIPAGEHEVLLEQEHLRRPIFDAVGKLFLGTVTS